MSRIISFRGLMKDGDNDIVPLHTTTGSTGYRITEFKLIGRTPGSMTIEAVVKIYKVPQSVVNGDIDFSDQTLLAAGYYSDNSSVVYPNYETIIFDKDIINQDIYITAYDASTGEYINYYIELEQMPLDLNENTVATLKDIRNITRTV